MKYVNYSHFNNSSKDAMTFAPCFCTARNYMNNANYTDIAIAMSVLLCLVLSIIGLISIIAFIIILGIILICGRQFWEKAVDNLA